jgi:4-amino-4-deoxy-L-arabinose transferase-like glycosyltransferase
MTHAHPRKVQRPPAVTTSPSRFTWAIAVILLLATVLYCYQLGTESLWNEELYSVNDARDLTGLGLIRPVYYVLLHFWMQVSTSDTWLRLLSVPFGLGSVFLTYQIGRRANGELTGLIAAAMLTLSPLFINFVQMVRMYSLSTFLGLAGTLALLHALERPTVRLYKVFWVILRVLVAITAPLNSTLLFADIAIIFFTFRRQRKILGNFTLWLGLALVLWLPSLLALVLGTLDFLNGALNVVDKVNSDTTRHAFPSLKDVVLRIRNFTASPFPSTSRLNSWFYQIYTLMMLGLLALGLVRRRVKRELLWITLWTIIPAMAFFLVSKRLWIDRYLLFLVPFLLILLAAGFVRLWEMKRLVAVGVAVVYLMAVGGGLFRYYSVLDRQDWRGVAEIISKSEQPGDIIVLSIDAPKMTTALQHYYQGDAPIYRVASACPSGDEASPSDDRADIPSEASRIWMLCGEGFEQAEFDQALGDRFQMVVHQQFTYENFYRSNSWMNLFLAESKG